MTFVSCVKPNPLPVLNYSNKSLLNFRIKVHILFMLVLVLVIFLLCMPLNFLAVDDNSSSTTKYLAKTSQIFGPVLDSVGIVMFSDTQSQLPGISVDIICLMHSKTKLSIKHLTVELSLTAVRIRACKIIAFLESLYFSHCP